MLKRRWGVSYTLINLGKVAWYKQQGESGLIVSVLQFVYVDLYANGYIYPPYTVDLGSQWVWLHLCLVDCYFISATISIFHFPEQCGD